MELPRSLRGKYVYLWADGIHSNVRLEGDRVCVLVLIGTLEDGTKELVAAHADLQGKQTVMAGDSSGS